MTDKMTTYTQYLESRHLSEVLLMKHVEEGGTGKLRLYGEIQVDKSFQKLAERLGYRVEKITADPARTLAYTDAGRPVMGASI